MSTDLTTPIPIGDILRTRVRDAIASAIPDEQMDEFIRKEFEAFTKPGRDRDQWNNPIPPVPSPLGAMIREEYRKQLEPVFKAKIAEHIGTWGDTSDRLIADLVKQIAPEVMAAMMEGVCVATLRNMRNQ